MELKTWLANTQENYEHILREFNTNIFPRAIARVNSGIFGLMAAKLPSEKLPQNERNLTDARTRIGTLLEYTLAVETNNVLQIDYELNSQYVMGFVLANQYPDLVLRNEKHEPVIRFEVKSIQGISEEKSANFDALVRNVKKNSDIVCVMLWEWDTFVRNGSSVEYPKIHNVFAFDAYTLALQRDLNWLANTITSTTTNRQIKLIDVSGAYVPNGSLFKEEEKNMGKLMRIDTTNLTTGIRETNELYEVFKREVAQFGIYQIVARCIEHYEGTVVENYNFNFYAGDISEVLLAERLSDNSKLLILAGSRQSKAKIKNIVTARNPTHTLVINDKFKWDLYAFSKTTNALRKIDEGNKPTQAYEILKSELPI